MKNTYEGNMDQETFQYIVKNMSSKVPIVLTLETMSVIINPEQITSIEYNLK